MGQAENKLTEAGIFKGAEGLRGLAENNAFWDLQEYGTRLYYGTGSTEYLHRDVLRTALKILDIQNETDK